MTETTSILPFRQGDEVDDLLTALAREGARRILAEALAAEADAFVAAFAETRLEDGRRKVVRHGAGPERMIQTGVGPVPVRRPKVRDRDPGAARAGTVQLGDPAPMGAPHAEPRCASAGPLPPRRLDGRLSGGARARFWGREAPNLSPSVIGRLKETWQDEYDYWQAPGPLGAPLRLRLGRRRLPAGADGAHRPSACSSSSAPPPEGKKELVRLPGRRARERAELARAAHRPQGPRARPRPRRSWWATARWASGGRSTRCSQTPATNAAGCTRPPTSSTRSPRSVQPGMKAALREVRDAPRPGDRRGRPSPSSPRSTGPSTPKGRRVPGEGPRRAARLLRLPGRALGSPAHGQPRRERLRHRAAPDRPNQGHPVAGHPRG